MRLFSPFACGALAATLGAAAVLACSSGSDVPGGFRLPGNADSGRSIGDWECYPELGEYRVNYRRVAGDPDDCPEEPEGRAKITEWSGGPPEYPDCVTTADEASCTITSLCQRATAVASSFEGTTVTYAKGKKPPVFGTRHIVIGTFVESDAGDGTTDGGFAVKAECKYEFTYDR